MALIFPFPSPPTTYLMVLPSGSWEHPLECMNWRGYLSLWVGACLSQKRAVYLPSTVAPASRALMWSAQPGPHQLWGLQDCPNQRKEIRDGPGWKHWELDSSPGNSGVAVTTGEHSKPWLSKSDCREGWATLTVGMQAAFVFLFGVVTLYPEYPSLKTIIFAIFDHVSLKDEV